MGARGIDVHTHLTASLKRIALIGSTQAAVNSNKPNDMRDHARSGEISFDHLWKVLF